MFSFLGDHHRREQRPDHRPDHRPPPVHSDNKFLQNPSSFSTSVFSMNDDDEEEFGFDGKGGGSNLTPEMLMEHKVIHKNFYNGE